MEKLDLEPLFPIWDLPTDQLAQTMITSGLKARITCIDPKKLPASFAGRLFDQDLINDLPEGIDHCGERGEFHTYTFAGPMFSAPITIKQGEIVKRDGFVFSDLILKTS
jgi:diphthamide synthase (EF-2-diphthine--ammonia ligase)